MIRRLTQLLQMPQSGAMRSSQRGEGPDAPLAPTFRVDTPRPAARGGVRRGTTTPADCPTNHSNPQPNKRPPFLRPVPIAALIIGLLQSGAAFTVACTAPAGGVGLLRVGERAPAIIRDLKLHGASTLPLAPASSAGPDGTSMPVGANHGGVLRVAGNLSRGGARA